MPAYAERLVHCERPENIEGPTPATWADINAYLGTTATCLSELIDQLGQRTFGHTPRVGDSLCGGGSIPFEAARIGCEAFGSDLNPVAGLLTWASLNLLGGGPEVQAEVARVQQQALSPPTGNTRLGHRTQRPGRTRRSVFVLCRGQTRRLRLLHSPGPQLGGG